MVRLSPGVDTDRFYPGCGGAEVRKRLGVPADAPVVVCTARMIKRKGQDTLIKAWPAVLREFPDAVLLLVGDGPNRSRVERLAERLGIEDTVIFAGSVPWEEVPAYTDAGNVFAMPCRTRLFGLEAEAFGIVFLEAAACGLQVIAGDSGGAPGVAAGLGARAVHPIDGSAVARAVIDAVRRERDVKFSKTATTNPQDRGWATVTAELRAQLAAL
jgi:phosphatidylinositol alpha-1,6-mannosyltransferase